MTLERLVLAVQLLNELISETDLAMPRAATIIEAKRCVLVEISEDYGIAGWRQADALPLGPVT